MSDFSSAYKRNERQEILIAPPMDLSFRKAFSMDELAGKRGQIVRTGKAPVRTPKDRFVTGTLWLSNNSLRSTKGLENLVSKVLEDPLYLSWLDLSFNQISEIGEEVTVFPNLKILYLHGNNISNINDVTKLRKLRNLRALTLHGNPIESAQHYRSFVVHVLPQLTNLDFSPIIAIERRRALPVGFFKIIRSDT